MKIKNQPTTLRRIIQGLLTFSLGIGTAQAVNYTKANTSTMSNATDWSPTTPWPPNVADTLTWQSSPISLANNLALSLLQQGKTRRRSGSTGSCFVRGGGYSARSIRAR